jgi:TonB-linked SusC/RagA family outer membrane protein
MIRINIKNCFVLAAATLLGMQRIKAQQRQDSLVNVAFGTVARKDLLGGVSTVNVPELLNKSYASYSLDNLRSLVSGYNGDANIWGQQALILVDGIPRNQSDIRLTEIESITVLKGASAVVLYGGSAAKGVVLITTKRGRAKPLTIDVRANTGMYVPKGYPHYLNAADYKTLYNEALTNDGISIVGPGYSNGDIDSTRAGIYGYKYPDYNLFSADYLRKAYSKTDLTTEISGGNERARYYTNIGMSYNNSIMKYGEQAKNNDFAFNVRGNVDMDLSKWLTASADAAIVLSNNYAGAGDFWGATSTVTPNFNRFSPFVPVSMLDPNNKALQTLVTNSNHLIDGQIIGGQSTNLTNVLGDMLAAGYAKNHNRTFMSNVGVKADLNNLLKGLSFKAGYSLDYSTIYSEVYQLQYAVYRPTWSVVNGKDVITDLQKLNNDLNSTSETIGRTSYTQTMSFRSQFNYDRTFASDHHVSANLLGWWYMTEFSSDVNNEGGSDYHPVRNSNLGFQANYDFRSKYYLGFSSALIHSAKLPPDNRNAFSPTVTLGWLISEEKFLKNKTSFLDNLKITASAASINQDLDITGTKPNGTPTDYYLYRGYYGNNTAVLGGGYSWRDGASSVTGVLSGQGENKALTFVKRQEFRAGVEASLLKQLITLDANYFIQNTNGLLTRGVTFYPSYFTGSGDFRNWLNYNNDRRSGIDFALNVNKNIGRFFVSAGVTGMVFSSRAMRRDEVYQDDYQYRAGKSLDANWGYISEGFFQDKADITSHAAQTFGGEIKPGDIKYKDVNNDGIIDTKDQVDLGHSGSSAPPFSYGVNLTVKWKNVTLFALGNGQSGAIGFKNSAYYWVRGTSKFSDIVWGRWTEDTKNTATYPRLTSTNGSNNYQNSTFWMYKTNRFNLNRVQLSYDFKESKFLRSALHGLIVYIQGDNLLVVSKERELMETNIGTAPQYRFYNLGAKVSF